MKVKFDIPIPDGIMQIKDIFKKYNHKLYLVGGAVRDSVIKKKIKDYDLATDALPDKVESMLSTNGIKTIATGKAFGVINAFTTTGEYEIAAFRKDIGKGRRPDSVEFTNIESDVQRRDLSINGLYYDIDTKEIIDLVGGIEDIKNGVVRTIGEPEDRFDEDQLRIMRAIRFAGKFGTKLDSKIDTFLKKGVSLKGISPERIRDEFVKGITTSKSPKYFLQLIQQYNLFPQIFPGMKINTNFIDNRSIVVNLAVILSPNDSVEAIQKQLNKLTYSVTEIKGIIFLLRFLELDKTNAVKLKQAQKTSFVNSIQIEEFAKFAKMNMKYVKAFIQFNLTVNGQELMNRLNLKPGVEVGQAIEKEETDNFIKLLK